MLKQPHNIVCESVQQKWASRRSKSFIQRLLGLGQVKPDAIIIIQTESLDETYKNCTGNILNKWRYDNSGLHAISEEIDNEKEKLNYCYYCIDREKKRIIVNWTVIMPSASTRKNLHYHHFGSLYEIIQEGEKGIYKVIRTWME